MESAIPMLETLLKFIDPGAAVTLSLIVIIFTLWIRYRKVVTEEKQSDSSIRNAQVESLVHQITLLSSELEKTRIQLKELHQQNLELMHELRNANKRISELEATLDKGLYEFQHSVMLESTVPNSNKANRT